MQQSGVGFVGLLAILFIGLKLGHVIDWSWVWVLCPLWAGIALIGVIMLFYVLVGGSAEAISHIRLKKRIAKRKATKFANWANR